MDGGKIWEILNMSDIFLFIYFLGEKLTTCFDTPKFRIYSLIYVDVIVKFSTHSIQILPPISLIVFFLQSIILKFQIGKIEIG